MLQIYTSQYRYKGSDRLDITVKGKDSLGKYFAPTWNMVMGFKSGDISQAKYTELYAKILDEVPKSIWRKVLREKRVVLVCFCRKDSFCHRFLLAKELEARGGIYKGEI